MFYTFANATHTSDDMKRSLEIVALFFKQLSIQENC